MKIKYDSNGEWWHGFRIWKCERWYDCGLFAIDYSRTDKTWKLYIWKWTITF